MKKATIEDMELGNLMFGNSRGMYAVEPRSEYQNIFIEFLMNNNFDGYGFIYGRKERDFENDTFIIRPYYWGEDEKKQELPNFVYKPTGLEISWYKYPLRDAYSNQDIILEEFQKIVDDCDRSLKEAKA